MFTQDDFDRIIRDYNEDYLYLLIRASKRSYECLISTFLMLKTLNDTIVKLQAAQRYSIRVVPYPLKFRGNDELLRAMGFDEEGIRNIYGFLEFVKETQNKEFEECLEGSVLNMCKRFPEDPPWQMKGSGPVG